jgi:AcrR family transcriptional regulator
MSQRAPAARERTGRYQQKREAILAAASDIFNRKGLKGATLTDVARVVDINANSLTYYYPRKEDLAADCLLRTVAKLEELIAAAATERSLAARVEGFFERWFALLADIADGRHTELITLYDFRALSGARLAKASARYVDFFRSVRSLVDSDAGKLPRLERNGRASLFVGAIHGVRTWVDRYESADYARAAKRTTDLLLHGLFDKGAVYHPATMTGADGAHAALAPQRDMYLRAATRLINDQGYMGASVEKICATLNVTKGAFYHHISAKDDLVGDCFRRSFAIIREAQAQATERFRDNGSRLAWSATALVRRQLGPDGPLLRYTALAVVPEAMREGFRRERERLTERFAGMVADGIVDGSVRPVDPTIAAHVLDTTINAAAELPEWTPDADSEARLAAYLRPLFDGLTPR